MLEGKVAVVTGGGRGIGRGVALALAGSGAKVVVNDYGIDLHGQEPSTGPAVDVVNEIKQTGGEAIANGDSVASWSGAANIINTPFVVYLATDAAANINGQIFMVMGGVMSLLNYPVPVRTITKMSRWTPEGIAMLFPSTLGMDLVNPAPPKSN